MATVRIPDEQRTLTDQDEVTRYLATLGIDYERWPDCERVRRRAAPEEVLAAYAPEIERLKAQGGYVTADVIDVTAQTPNLEAMLAKFRTEHWHDEDEVRFIVRGRGLFHVHPGKAVRSSRSRSRRATSSACRAAPGTGSICAAIVTSAPSGSSRTNRVGRPTTRRAAPTRVTSRSAWVPRTSRFGRRRADEVGVVLLDIEGTTTPIDFVHQTLFGYARARVSGFLERQWNDPEVQADVARAQGRARCRIVAKPARSAVAR